MSKYRNPEVIKEIIIHCAATPNGQHFTISDIDNWHKARKFKRNPVFIGMNDYTFGHVGYHIVIDLEGNICNGRKINETGAHALGRNIKSIGICLIGTDKFTIEQWDTLKYTVESLINRFTNIKIIGHNEISRKLCPGFDVKAWVNNGMVPEENRIINQETNNG